MVDGTTELDRQQAVGSGGTVFVFDAAAERFGLRRLAFEQRDRFAESPLQVNVADLLAGTAVVFSVG